MEEGKANNEEAIRKWYLSEFQYDKESRIYVLAEQEAYIINYSDGIKKENDIFDSIKNAKDLSSDSDDLMRAVKDWSSYYHLGIGRSNILRALDLSTNAKVLELGSGCGALTRYLGENFESVDGIEGSPLRARIARERCRDLGNVRIFCSNFKYIKFGPTYNIVTLIGVLEYAPRYFSHKQDPNDACLTLLKLAKTALKKDGILIIAIENKIGVKYWSGCPDDHTGKIFDSIQGYPGEKGPITFSKKEIKTLLKEVGFSNVSFYSCFPDYKFASTIVSDIGDEDEKDFYLHNWIEIPFSSYNVPRIYTFHEALVIKTLSESGLLSEFANSFLIVANQGKSTMVSQPDWIVKKFSMRRREQFRCITTLKIKPKVHVEKRRLLENIEDIVVNTNNIKIKHRVADLPWYKGDLMIFDVFERLFESNFKERILEILRLYYKELIDQFYTGSNDQEGYPILQGPIIDFIFGNIIRKGQKLLSIDNEWWIENICADYVMYRCIKYDIIGLQKPWVKEKIKNTDKSFIELMRYFFPKYGNIRHNKNKRIEESIQNFISGSLNIKMSHLKFQFLRKPIVWALIKNIWNILPQNIKVAITKWMEQR